MSEPQPPNRMVAIMRAVPPPNTPSAKGDPPVPVCIDCRHMVRTNDGAPQCAYGGARIDPVLGRVYELKNCRTEREKGRFPWFGRKRCGPEGLFFEHRPASDPSDPPPSPSQHGKAKPRLPEDWTS